MFLGLTFFIIIVFHFCHLSQIILSQFTISKYKTKTGFVDIYGTASYVSLKITVNKSVYLEQTSLNSSLAHIGYGLLQEGLKRRPSSVAIHELFQSTSFPKLIALLINTIFAKKSPRAYLNDLRPYELIG